MLFCLRPACSSRRPTRPLCDPSRHTGGTWFTGMVMVRSDDRPLAHLRDTAIVLHVTGPSERDKHRILRLAWKIGAVTAAGFAGGPPVINAVPPPLDTNLSTRCGFCGWTWDKLTTRADAVLSPSYFRSIDQRFRRGVHSAEASRVPVTTHAIVPPTASPTASPAHSM